MRNRLSVTCGVVALLAVAALVQATPIAGTYQGPAFLDGRWSESYIGGASLQAGNVIHAGSWDGATLEGQWTVQGATVTESNVLSDQVYPGGFEVVQFSTTCTGGTLTLLSGPWTTGGDGDYVFDLTNFTMSNIVVLFQGVVLPGTTGLVSMQGVLQGDANVTVDYLFATAKTIGEGAAAPAGYPSITAAQGAWGDAQGMQMKISVVPEPATMALLGMGALAMALRRRRK